MKNQLALPLSLLLLTLFSCQPNPTTNQLQLTNVEAQKQFLQTIYILDQQVREDETTANQKYGYDSPEHKAAWEKLRAADIDNLHKVELYLKTYGHPTLKEHGDTAASTPWIVIHHSDGVLPRERNFKYIYQAWKNKDLDNGQLTFYLNRMHEMKYNKRLRWDRTFNFKEELDSLVMLLNLQHIVEEVEKGKS